MFAKKIDLFNLILVLLSSPLCFASEGATTLGNHSLCADNDQSCIARNLDDVILEQRNMEAMEARNKVNLIYSPNEYPYERECSTRWQREVRQALKRNINNMKKIIERIRVKKPIVMKAMNELLRQGFLKRLDDIEVFFNHRPRSFDEDARKKSMKSSRPLYALWDNKDEVVMLWSKSEKMEWRRREERKKREEKEAMGIKVIENILQLAIVKTASEFAFAEFWKGKYAARPTSDVYKEPYKLFQGWSKGDTYQSSFNMKSMDLSASVYPLCYNVLALVKDENSERLQDVYKPSKEKNDQMECILKKVENSLTLINGYTSKEEFGLIIPVEINKLIYIFTFSFLEFWI